MDEEKLRLLYEAVSKDYGVGTYDEFSTKLADPTKRKAFYDGVGKEYDLGTYDEFEGKIAKPVEVPTEEDPLYGTKQLDEVVIRPQKDEGFLSDTWNMLAQGLNSVYSGLLDIPKVVYEIAAIPQNFIADEFNVPSLRADYESLANNLGAAGTPLKMLNEASSFYRGQSKQYSDQVTKFEDGIYESVKKGNFGDAGRQLSNAIVGSAPALAQIYVTAGAGSAANLGTFGKTALNALPFASNKLAEIEDNPDIKSYQKPIIAGLNGLSEVVFEQAFGSKAILDGVIKELREGATDVAERKVKEFAQGYLQKLFAKNGVPVSFVKGGASEGLTQFTQNFIDKYSGVDPERDLMAGVADAVIVGGVMDSSIQGAGNLLSSIKNSKAKQTATQLQEEITALKQDVDKTNSEAVNDVLEQKTEELSKLIDDSAVKEASLTPEQTVKADELSTRADAIEGILKDDTLSEGAKTALNEELNQVNTQLDEILPENEGISEGVDGILLPVPEKVASFNGDEVSRSVDLGKYYNQDGTEFLIRDGNDVDGYTVENRTDPNRPVLTVPLEELTKQKLSKNIQEAEIVSEPEIIDTEGVLPTEPVVEDKLKAIQDRRVQAFERVRQKLGNVNSGLNPDVITDLVEIGVTYIEEGVIKFKDFAERLKADSGRDFEDQDLREIYRQSAESMGLGVRGFGERVRTEETTPTETAELLDETEQLYERQDYDEIRGRLDQMDDAEKQRLVGTLEAVTSQLNSEQNIGVLAGIDLINKYNSEGKFAEATQIIESLSKSATVAAQTLRQYGEFKNSTPDGYIQLVDKWMAKAGKKLTEGQKTKIQELFVDQQAKSAAVDEALAKVTEDLSDQNYKDYYNAVIGYEDAIRSLEDYIDLARGRNLPDTLAKILQGNLLSLKSVVINPFANFMQFLVRGAENDVATVVDQAMSLITSRTTKSPTLSEDNIRLGSRAVAQGVKRATRKAVKGTANSELAKYDVGGRLRPKVALQSLYNNLKSADTRRENQYSWSQGLSDFAEGTLGVPANIMFRLLPFGDDPFFEQAKTQRLVEIGKNDKSLEGQALEKFILNPDKKSLEDAETYGKEATFQEDNVISRNINRLIGDGAKRIEEVGGRQASAAYRLVMKGILPFVNTPSSIALKTIKFAVPAIPAGQAVYDATQLVKAFKMNDSALKERLIRRHQKNFSEHMGQAIISGAVLGAATILVANGLATGDLPEDEFQKKQRNFMFATQPPNTINVDGVKRMLAGEDATYKQGDKTISYVPLGLLGAQIGIVSSTRGSELREAKKKANVVNTKGELYYPETDANPLNFVGNFLSNAPAALRYFFNQSFVQGAETVLNSVATENGAKSLIPQLGKTFTSIGIPNTVAQSFRASNEYMRDLYTDSQLETFANIVGEKVGNVEDLPIKYDMWGKPIKQTPEGSNPYVYQVLDIFRTQKILQDPITFAVFDIQRKTGEDAAIPGSVDDTFNKKDFKVKLDKQQKADLTKLVGEERRKIVEKVLRTYNEKSDPEKYIPRLKSAYERGAKLAKSKFTRRLRQDAQK